MDTLGNQAKIDGGSLSVDDKNQLTIIHTNFSCEFSLLSFAFIRICCIKLTVKCFVGNHGTNGGVIRLLQNNLLTIEEITLLGTSSTTMLFKSLLNHNDNNVFVENSASKDGGAIWCKDNNNLTIMSTNYSGDSANVDLIITKLDI